MTHKEKAIDLYEKMYYKTPSILSEKNKDKTAKQCALIATDEIMDVLGGWGIYTFDDIKVAEYWKEVKKEIEKL